MNERLDYLLSVALDDELDNEERAELDRLLVDHPEAAERRARFESINGVVKTIGAQPSNRDAGLDAGLLALQERLDEVDPEPVDELARRRRRPVAAWIPSLGLAAAAALAVYLVLPQDSSVPDWFADSAQSASAVVAEKVATAESGAEIDVEREADGQAERVAERVAETKAEPSENRAARMPAPMVAKSALVPTAPTATRALVDEPIALAVVFEIDEDPESTDFIDSMSPDDFEIIEQLELLEFMAAKASETARESEGRG